MTDTFLNEEKQMPSDGKKERKTISYGRLVYEYIPELWSFQIISGIVLSVLAFASLALLNRITENGGRTVVWANLRSLILSWRFPAILAVGFAVMALFVVVEIFSQIHNCYDMLNGQRTGIFHELKKSVPDIRRFLNPDGIGLLAYVFLAVPLTGIGLTIRLTESFTIPNFMRSIFAGKSLYAAGLAALYVFLVFLGIRWLFAFHAVLIDKVHPREGKRISVHIIKKHGKTYLLHVLKFLFVFFLVYLLFYIFLNVIPGRLLAGAGAGLTPGYRIEPERLAVFSDLTRMETKLISYRVLSVFYVLFNDYINLFFAVLGSAYLVLLTTKDYLAFTRGAVSAYRPGPRRFGYRMKTAWFAGVFIVIAAASVIMGIFFTPLFEREEPAEIIAHRGGGNMAVENSLEGLEQAIAQGCYGSEIDIQRTKEGFYVVHHDNTFRRMAGITGTSEDLTLDDIRALTINDKNGEETEIPVLDDTLDISKGKIILFIELKGKTADEKMADDVVRMVREKDCAEDVVLISMKRDLIEYVEKVYPEFETGAVIYAGLGNIERLDCDLLIMQEKLSAYERVSAIHREGKKVITWTVNTKSSMKRFFDSDVDGIITDKVVLAEKIREELASRSDLEVIQAAADSAVSRLNSLLR